MLVTVQQAQVNNVLLLLLLLVLLHSSDIRCHRRNEAKALLVIIFI